jgi:hypothetical protein
MNGSLIVSLWLGILIVAGPLAAAESSDAAATPFLGVIPDWRHLPELVSKHVGLAPGKGLRIDNVFLQSPADKAGIERDDILVAFQGQDINDIHDFGEALSKAGVGKLVFLDVIHAGQHKTLRVTLEARPKDPKFKYPPSFGAMGGTSIGGIWRQGKDGKWERVDGTPDANGIPLPFRQGVYTFTYDQTTVVIEGNPRFDASTVIVRSGQQEHRATVAEKDKLPAVYHDLVEQAVKLARQESDRAVRMWDGRGFGGRGDGRGRSGGPPPGPDRMTAEDRDRSSQEHIQRVLEGVTRYIEGLQQSSKPMQKLDIDRLKLIEEQLHQIQVKIDQLQKLASQEPNR